jgi:uncharacterized membrane protein YidH (DUF202 family)
VRLHGPAGQQSSGAGLQAERTSLAWHRTAASMVVAGLLFLRWVPAYGGLPLAMTALAVAAAASVGASRSWRYRRQAVGLRAGRIGADVIGVGLTAFGVLLIGTLALGAVLGLPLR